MIDDFAQFGISQKFDDPFLLYSSESMPRDLVTALDWCRFLYFLNPQYRQASHSVVSHFVTDFDYPNEGDQREHDTLDDLLHNKLNLPAFLIDIGDEWACYGNGFARIHYPFDRFLIDPHTGNEWSIDMFRIQDTRFDLGTMTYDVVDPKDEAKSVKNRRRVKMSFRDRKSLDTSRIKLTKIDPRYMTLRHNKVAGTTEFVWRFDEQIIADVKKGKLFMVNGMHQQMLRAIANKEDFLFREGQIFHFKAPTISGISNNGWGIPGTLANYRSLYQLQVYRKIDEAIGLDYMIPFRLFTPNFGDKLNDVFNNLLMGQWTGSIQEVIRNRRRDKFAIHALPFPVNYQEFGAEGKELADKDLIEYQTNSMLDGMGYPVELFKGSLAYMQVPTAMRMFENRFMFIQTGFSDLVKWTAKNVQNYLGQKNIRTDLQKPSIADSIEDKQIILQLASAGEISRETAYDTLGVENPIAEIKKRMQEDIGIQKAKTQLDQDFQREMESGAVISSDGQAQGGQPGGVTPTDVEAKAQSLAQSWMAIQGDGQRRNAMQAVKAQDPTLYARAKDIMESTREQGASQGRAQANQQMQQGGQAGPVGGPAGQPQQ